MSVFFLSVQIEQFLNLRAKEEGSPVLEVSHYDTEKNDEIKRQRRLLVSYSVTLWISLSISPLGYIVTNIPLFQKGNIVKEISSF